MRHRSGISLWLAVLLFGCATSALGRTWYVGIGDDCDPEIFSRTSIGYAPACFSHFELTIDVGDRVYFYEYPEASSTGPHNVVADDGSFRCAIGCDGEGGDGTPVSSCVVPGCAAHTAPRMSFFRDFAIPGIVKYHDEVSGAPGIIYVGVSPSDENANGHTAIDGGYTGTWFDSAQSGMGFMLEVLPGSPMQLLAAWLTFSPQGDPAWIVGVGPIANNQASLQATQMVGAGARFPPSFDPTNVQTQSWGALTFTFADCNHGHVDWSSTIAGYVSGGMDLTRLTQPAGLTCLP